MFAKWLLLSPWLGEESALLPVGTPPHALGKSQSEMLVLTLWCGRWLQCPGRRGLRSFPVFKMFFYMIRMGSRFLLSLFT